MIIPDSLFPQCGAQVKRYNPGDLIFSEGQYAHFFYQLQEGKVKLNNYNEEGTEFLQNIVHAGDCFGESILFTAHAYPMNAEVLEESLVLKVPKDSFFEILAKKPEIWMKLSQRMAERLYFKQVMLQNNALRSPSSKLLALLFYFKSFSDEQEPFCFKVNYTRQQLASLTGLSVETVIRTIKQLEKEKELQIKNSKVYL
ncbi:Crp/Fnr family transcriptional regulator [Chryseobacterium sp. A301]